MNEAVAIKFMDIIESTGVNNIVEKEFRAGIKSGKELKEVFEYLRNEGWDLIDAVIAADTKALNTPIGEKKKGRKKSSAINTTLNRKIRNLFSKAEIADMGIMDMTASEAEKLCADRMQQLLDGTFKHFGR